MIVPGIVLDAPEYVVIGIYYIKTYCLATIEKHLISRKMKPQISDSIVCCVYFKAHSLYWNIEYMFAYATHFRSKIGHISVCYYTSKLFTSCEKQIESN